MKNLKKCTEFYYPKEECGIIRNDTDLNINWSVQDVNEVILSDKDKEWGKFEEV